MEAISSPVIPTCGIMVSLERKSCRPMVEMSWPSIHMLPPAALMMRKRARVNEDLPAPVRPTMPILRGDKSTLYFIMQVILIKKKKSFKSPNDE